MSSCIYTGALINQEFGEFHVVVYAAEVQRGFSDLFKFLWKIRAGPSLAVPPYLCINKHDHHSRTKYGAKEDMVRANLPPTER